MGMSNTLSCPVPTSINPLSPNGFQFSIDKLPTVSYFCQEANIPQISFPALPVPTPLSTLYIPNTVLQFAPLEIKFMISEDMSNYMAAFGWMMGLGFPESYEQYSTYIRDVNNNPFQSASDLAKNYGTGTLSVLGVNNVPIRTITYTDLFPTSLSSLVFKSTNSDVNYLIGSATFHYSFYTIT